MMQKELLLGQLPLFAALPPEELRYLAATLREKVVPHGALLFREGDYGDRFYVVIAGELEIIKALDTASEFVLDARGAGEFIGEMSLLHHDGLRTASVRARGTTRLLEMSRAEFDALLHRQPTLAYEMVRVLSNRLRDANNATIRDLREKNSQLTQALLDLRAAQAQIIEQETLARELRLAREIQESMLPRKLPQLTGFEIGGRMIAARMVGGDFYDAIPLDADRVGVVIGDVSGKGVPAALLMALVCSLLRAEAVRTDSPEEVLRVVNGHLLSRNARGMFVTVLYGVLHRVTREFTFVRAGHELPLVLDAGGANLTPERGRGHPLGMFASPALDSQTVVVPPGGTLLLFTDGVTEAMDQQGELFGVERIAEAVRDYPRATAQELCDHLVDAVTAYHGAAPQADDITLLAVRAR